MHFTEFRLINFGLYPGEHVIDVRPSRPLSAQAESGGETTDRPIVLIGGKNGAGKTTILEAVRICLYGAAALGKGTKRAAYESYLLSRIHRQAGMPLHHTFAGVGVGFIHTVGGTTHEFTLRRMWQRRRSGVSETVQVTRDGLSLNDQEMGWWEQFLHDLLPPGLADLFFFDGEKIQSLADDPDYTLLGESIRSLLGLDLLDRLRGDLAVYLARQRRSGGQSLDDLLSDLLRRRDAVEAAFRHAHADLGRINSMIAHKQGKIEEAERHLMNEGGGIAAQRDMLQQRAETLQETIRRYERAIAEQANGLLPFAIIPQFAHVLKAQLELDERVEQYIQVSTVADYFVEEFAQRLIWDNDWLDDIHLSKQKREKLTSGLNRKAQAIRDSLVREDATEFADQTVVHPLEKDARRELITWLDQATTLVPQQLAELAQNLESALVELAAVEATLFDLPAEEAIQPIIRQLSTLQRELGALEVQKQTQETVVQQLRQKREALDREEKELYTRLMRGDDPDYRRQLASRAQYALVRYEEALRRAKITELEAAIVECFGRLSRKGRYIRRVHIDPETFMTTLYNQKGDALPREQLSAGEKQIYAVAVLWALRLVSGRALPIIVDTPLGRLDSDHRQRLVQHYFPQASHQVVLLSTDTEVDAALYADLAPAIARAYQLVYQPGDASTRVTEGYFPAVYEEARRRNGVISVAGAAPS
ncbi:MAG: DNA sulfur modification protein DndD [Chloroflexales bacterium]|nr:DNA sulfur modification protein DndD [Chloroflexales bacterium]